MALSLAFLLLYNFADQWALAKRANKVTAGVSDYYQLNDVITPMHDLISDLNPLTT